MDATEPAWMAAARSKLGEHELAGDADNPFIVACLAAVGLPHQHDETAWCSAFANWAMRSVGMTATGRANARSWLQWGEPLPKPIIGAVCVFSRPPDPSHGHVGFYAGETEDSVLVLGGNEDNRVEIKPYPKARLIGYRWPTAGQLQAAGAA